MKRLFEIDLKDYKETDSVFRRPSARAVIIRDDKIALVYSKREKYYKFPGGGIHDDEDKKEALAREVREEVGMVVIPESIREFGSVLRRQKSDKAEDTIFEQENYYYFCDVQNELVNQELDAYESEAEFVLKIVDIDTAIRANDIYKSDVLFNEVMIKRELRVLRLLKMSKGMGLVLIRPSKDIEDDAVKYKEEHFDYGEEQVHGSSGLAFYDDYDKWLDRVTLIGERNPQNGVQTSTFFSKRLSDGKLIGCIKIHHSLTDDLKNGGHIAYGIRPSERGKGYGKEQLQLCLEYARKQHMSQVIVACDSSNVASAKTAMSCGGILTKEFEDDGIMKQHYTIDFADATNTTRIIFVRHAKSQYGEDDRIRPLTDDGLKSREIVVETLKEFKIDCFMSSPYKRSVDTIQPAADYFGMQIVTDERFRERKIGKWDDGWLEKRWADFSCAEEGGESLASVQKRNIEALKEVIAGHVGETVVIGTHGTALATVLNYYDSSFGLADFMRIVARMPYIVELVFEGDELIEKKELAHVDTTID